MMGLESCGSRGGGGGGGRMMVSGRMGVEVPRRSAPEALKSRRGRPGWSVGALHLVPPGGRLPVHHSFSVWHWNPDDGFLIARQKQTI